MDWAGKMFSGGWVTAQGGTLTSTEPATGQILAEVGLASGEDVARAAAQARGPRSPPGPPRRGTSARR